ncbi:MAG: hypothetical protein GY851_33210 [bacterium]|nr:hypothetical protein [bacterium]
MYSTFQQYGKTALVRDEWRLELAGALLEGEGCEPAGMTGRSQVHRLAFSGGTGIIRQCRRGGFIRHFVKDSYLLENRPLHELRIHVHLYEQGFAVPEPLGILWERRGLWFRGAIATREVNAENLLDYLGGAPPQAHRVLERAGRLIREMHELGVYHADLQVRNILVAPEHPYIIDLDKATLKPRVSSIARLRNLLRLRRSFNKNFLPLRYFEPLCRGYGIDSLPRPLTRITDEGGIFARARDLRPGNDADE